MALRDVTLIVALITVLASTPIQGQVCWTIPADTVCTESNCFENKDCNSDEECCALMGCRLCLNKATGRPRTTQAPGCVFNNVAYPNGATFPKGDNCNNCTCADNAYQCGNATCPSGCVYNNVTYNNGATFPKGDNCNNCTCAANAYQCGNVTCPPVTQSCVDGNWTYKHGDKFTSSDGCNNCTCDNGRITCSNKTCEIQCRHGNKTYSDGKTFTNSDGCNNCTCAAGNVLCTNETCSLSNCDYNGHQYASGATFKSDDNCNSCFCTNGVVGCTKMACIDTCETQKLRECFVDLVDTTFYAMTEPNKLWMCRSKDAVQSCVERNLKVCQKEFGAVMTAVLTPHVRVMTTLTDAFCSMDTVVDTSSPALRHVGQCLNDYAKVLSYGSLLATCRQSKTTILCLKEAAADCTGEQKDGFSLLTSVIEQAMVSACQPDTCSLGVAEQCVIEAVYAVHNPLYREGGSTLTCGMIQSGVSCAMRSSAGCSVWFAEERKSSINNTDQITTSRDRGEMAATNADDSEGLLKEYLMFIKDMKAQWNVEAGHGDREMGDKDDKDSRSWKDIAFEDKSDSEEQKMKAREAEKDKEQQQLALHLETIRGRVKILIRKLNERDGVVTKNRNNMTNAVATDFTETLEELEGNVEHLKAKVAQALTGSDVHMNIKKLKYLRERLTVFMNVSDASWNMSVSQDMKDRFENARLYIQSEFQAQMENLHGRLDYVTSTLHFLNASLGNFCDGRKDSFTLATNVLDYDLITIIGTLVTSPYIEKADVCRFLSTINEGDFEVLAEAKSTLSYIHMIVGDLCVAKEPVMNATKLDCIPAAEYKTMCNQTQAVKCVDLRELVNTAMKVESTEDFTDLCRLAKEGMDCFFKNTDACDTTVPLEIETTRIKDAINKFAAAHCDLSPPNICQVAPTCDMEKALDLCFVTIDGFNLMDICKYVDGRVIPCLKNQTSACNYSMQTVVAQQAYKRFLVEKKAEKCGGNFSLWREDATLPVANCTYQYFRALVTQLGVQPNWTSAVCGAMIQYSTCENNSSFPLIENIVTAQHIGFYENFWMENCMHVSVNGSGKVGDRVSLTGCPVDTFMERLTLYISKLSFGASSWSAEKYRLACSNQTFIEQETKLKSLLSGATSTCSQSARNMLMEGITYLGMVRKEYCPLPEWSPSNSCALAEVRKCAWKVGKYIALATPYSDACEYVEAFTGCVEKFSVGCAANESEAILKEVQHVQGIVGNLQCQRPSWCAEGGLNATNRTAGVTNDRSSWPFCTESVAMEMSNATNQTWAACSRYLTNSSSDVCTNTKQFVVCLRETRNSADVVSAVKGKIETLAKVIEHFVKDYCPEMNETTPVDGTCPLNGTLMEKLSALLQKVAMATFHPFSDRMEQCSNIHTTLSEISQPLPEPCNGTLAQEIVGAKTFVKGLFDTLGFCGKESMVRRCEPTMAIGCVQTLGSEVVQYRKTGFKQAMCSKHLLTELCVSHNLAGCMGDVKRSVESTYSRVSRVIEQLCAPPTKPEPSLQCSAVMPEERTEERTEMRNANTDSTCNLLKADMCLYQLYADLNCDKPTWGSICLSLPYVSACVHRHIHNCSEDEKKTVMTIGQKLMARVGDRCPQVSCDVCRAERCFQRLDGLEKNDSYCRIAKEVSQCVKQSTMTCGMEHAHHIWARAQVVSKNVDVFCENRIHTCFAEFRDAAWSLLLYNGSTIAPADLSANITTPDTNHRAITNCTDFTYVDEPWYGGELVNVLKQISSAENGEIEDDSHDDDGVARTDATAGNASLPQRNARVCKRPRTSPLHVNLKSLCDKLYRAWDCLASHQTTISEEVGPTVRSTLSAILQAVSSKCRVTPLQCHQCTKAGSHLECDAQPVETCSADKQMCQTIEKKGKEGYISKMCVSPDMCTDRCTTDKCETCCVGPLCNRRNDENNNDTAEDQPSCTVFKQTQCAFNLVTGLHKSKRMVCRLLFEAVDCMTKMSKDCSPDETLKIIHTYAKKLGYSRAWRRCLAKERDCQCGAYNLFGLLAAVNPYTPDETLCSHFEKSFMVAKKMTAGQCTKDDVTYTRTGLTIVHSQLANYCESMKPKVEPVELVCPTLTSNTTCETECSKDKPCSDPELTCCEYPGCFLCQRRVSARNSTSNTVKDPDVKPVVKPGYCPPVGETGICMIECDPSLPDADSSCGGTKKCCPVACGGGQCFEPLLQKPPPIVQCPEDVTAACSADPCGKATCSNHPNATCKSINCRACVAHFYMDGVDVTSTCSQQGPEVCSLEFDSGPCSGANTTVWTYNNITGRCEEAMYSGCEGNKNRFNTQQQCWSACFARSPAFTVCRNVSMELKSRVPNMQVIVKLLDQQQKCSFISSTLEYALHKCPVESERENITMEVLKMLAFNLSVCEAADDTSNTNADMICLSNSDVRTKCKSVVKTCNDLLSRRDCMRNVTKGCNSVQLIPLQNDLSSTLTDFTKTNVTNLGNTTVTCNVSVTDLYLGNQGNSVGPVLTCLNNFIDGFSLAALESYLLTGAGVDICTSAAAFRSCVFKTEHLQMKSLIANILEISSQLSDNFCDDVDDMVSEPSEEPIKCYSCKGAPDNNTCNTNIEVCPFNKQSCQTIYEIRKGVMKVTKGCKNPFSNIAMDKAKVTKSRVLYRWGCTKSLCNGPLQPSTITTQPSTNTTQEKGQWVSKVIKYSSQYGTGSWSAQQILGVSNVYPKYGDLDKAWAPKVIDANQFLEFQFATPVYVTKVDIYETYHAGGVKAIKCLDVSGTWMTLWSTPQVSVIQSARIFSPSFTSTIPCFSNHIRLDIDCSVSKTWVEIDAVMLHGPPALKELDTCNCKPYQTCVNKTCVCPTTCPAVVQPVCARDTAVGGKIREFNNQCLLNKASCEANGTIQFLVEGPCPLAGQGCRLAEFSALASSHFTSQVILGFSGVEDYQQFCNSGNATLQMAMGYLNGCSNNTKLSMSKIITVFKMLAEYSCPVDMTTTNIMNTTGVNGTTPSSVIPNGPVCDPYTAATLVSRLSLSLSECVVNKTLQLKVCRSVHLIEKRIWDLLSPCPLLVAMQVKHSWRQVSELAHSVCDPEDEDLPLVPACLSMDYANVTGVCRPSRAVECLGELEREVFAETSTENRFCTYLRYAVRCFIDHTATCDPYLAAAMNPLMRYTLAKFDGRCGGSWCPVSDPPVMCDLETAHICYARLQIGSLVPGADTCRLVMEVTDCVKESIMDCDTSRKLLGRELLSRVEVLSGIVCEPRPPIIVPDLNLCLTTYKNLAFKLLNFDWNVTINITANIDVGAMGKTAAGGAKGTDPELGTRAKRAADDVEKISKRSAKTKQTNKTKQSKKSTKTKKTVKKSTKSGGISTSRNSWIQPAPVVIKESASKLCAQLEAAWLCVEPSLSKLETRHRLVVLKTLQAIHNAVTETCKPIQCYSCKGIASNEVCNSQPTNDCPVSGQQMCYSQLTVDGYSKGCGNPTFCAACQGLDDCYCCHGHKCNQGDDAPICKLEEAITCFADMITLVVQAKDLTYVLIKNKIECVIEHTMHCVTSRYYALYKIAIEIRDMFNHAVCVGKYGDPSCGTPSILALGYFIQNPLKYKPPVCRQLEVTRKVRDSLEAAEVCGEAAITSVSTDYQLASQTLSGFCMIPDGPDRGVCDISSALANCTDKQTWLAAGDNQCSVTGVKAFKDCAIKYTKGCLSVQRSALYLPALTHIDRLKRDCEKPPQDLDKILSEIFVGDSLSSVSTFYVEFIQQIKFALVNSLDFNEDMCKLIVNLRANLTTAAAQASPLTNLVTNLNLDFLANSVEAVCKDPSITTDTVKEECGQSKIDIVMALDSSGSIQEENFELVRAFALNVVRLADTENIRIGVMQFSKDSYHEFYMNDFLETVNGKEIQNKTKMEKTLIDMEYKLGGTNTHLAINKAISEYFTTARGARKDVKRHLLIVTDGKSNEGNLTLLAAGNAKAMYGIHIFAVGIAMNEPDQKKELHTIASTPSDQNVLEVKEFSQLDVVYKKIFVHFCRLVIPSYCQFETLVEKTTDDLMLSLTYSYSAASESDKICRTIEKRYTGITNETLTCSRHQKNSLNVIQSITMASMEQNCLTLGNDQGQDWPCDITKVMYCLRDVNRVLRGFQFQTTFICKQLEWTVDCLNYYVPACTNKTEIARNIYSMSSMVVNRCPKELARLQCWVDNNSSTTGNQTQEVAGQGSCDIVTMATECVGGFSLESINPLNLCGSFATELKKVKDCAIEKFVKGKCAIELLKQLEDTIVQGDNAINSFLRNQGCEVDTEIKLPANYGVVSTRTCELVPVCDMNAAEACVAQLMVPGSVGCGNWPVVQECIQNSSRGCGGIEYYVRLASIRSLINLPDSCLTGMNWTKNDDQNTLIVPCIKNAVQAIGSSVPGCEVMRNFINCIRGDLRPMVVRNVFRSESILNYLDKYCVEVKEVALDPNCNVSATDVKCLQSYALTALPMFAQPRWSQLKTCQQYGIKLPCMSNMTNACTAGQRAHNYQETYHLLEAYVAIGGACHDEPLECVTNTALQCVHSLAKAVSVHNYLSTNATTVCLELEATRKCLVKTLTGCALTSQQSVMKTFLEIECMALDICISGEDLYKDPEGMPLACVEPNVVAPNATCRPSSAFDCMRSFHLVADNPFVKNKEKVVCLAYSRMVQCVYDHMFGCNDIQKKILTTALNMKVIPYKCPTRLADPCVEIPDCGAKKAQACIDLFNQKLNQYREEDMVCSEIDKVEVCINESIVHCSKSAVSKLDADFKLLVTKANAKCGDDFYVCANKYISLTRDILAWKKCAETTTDSKETGSKKTGSKETGSKETGSKETGSKKTGSKETGSKKTGSKETGSKKTGSKETKKTNKTPEMTLDRAALRVLCTQWMQSWMCMQGKWDILSKSVKTHVVSMFTSHHSIVMNICNGWKPGYCPVDTKKSSIERTCETDDECSTTKKCCVKGTGTLCTTPKDDDCTCYSKFADFSQQAMRLTYMLYKEDDKGMQFCILYAQLEVSMQGFLKLRQSCPAEYFTYVTAIWSQITGSYALFCNVPTEPPSVCRETDAEACLAAFEVIQAKNTNMDTLCTEYNKLTLCIEPVLTQCEANVTKENEVIVRYKARLKKIQDSLICFKWPTVMCEVKDSNILLHEGKIREQQLGFRLASDPEKDCSNAKCSIKLHFQVIEDKKNQPKCSNGLSIQQILVDRACDMDFNSSNWDKTQTVSLTARLDLKKDNKFAGKLKVMATLVRNGVASQSQEACQYNVVVIDTDDSSICQTTNDPHLKTFDGNYYNNHLQGEFTMVKNADLDYEVRVMFKKCTDNKKGPSCNCGVSVRVGDDTYVHNQCFDGDRKQDVENRKPKIWNNGEISKGLRIVTFNDGKDTNLYLPYGQVVNVKTSYSGFINIFVSPSPADKGNTEGLCGNYDGNEKNDWIGPDGTLYKDVDKFNKAWQSPVNDFLFEGVLANPGLPSIGSFCLYNDVNQQCSCNAVNLLETCEFQKGIDVTTTLKRVVVVEANRKKRAVGDPFAALGIDVNAPPIEAKTFPTASGITLEQANTTCYNALTGAGFAAACASLVPQADIDTKISNCVEDILYVDDLNTPFIQAAVEAFMDQCQSVAIQETNSSVVNQIRDVACPNSCSGHGQCQNLTCTCDAGFSGSDCSVDINAAPSLNLLDDPQCVSTIKDQCTNVNVLGSGFVEGAVCHLETVQITEKGVNKTNSKVTNVRATWLSFEEVTCTMSQAGGLPLHAVLVSVSNNGQVTSQSAQQLFLAHNPICFDCRLDANNTKEGTCKKETASCYVDGVCYKPLERKISDPCYICDVYTQQMIYHVSANCPMLTTQSSVNAAAQEMNDTLVIGLSAGVSTFVFILLVIVVAIVVFRHIMHKKKSSERKKLAKRSPSLSDSGADGHFQEVMFAAPNPAYSYFVEQIPQRHHSKRSDPTRETYPQQNGREWRNGQQKDGKRPRQRRDDGEREDFVDFSRNTYS